MNIVMMTNTYTPHVGGVARSVEAFVTEFRRRGHRVQVVAPEFSGAPDDETDVLRVSAIQNFNGSDFSVVLPLSPWLMESLEEFEPEIVHAHHPFLLGMTAVRFARKQDLPLVFTHHTLYEQYTHYVPGDSPAMRRFAIELATRYANLSDQVFAPSESIRGLLLKRGVTTPIAVVPTGVQPAQFAEGDGPGFRREHGIPEDAFVAGHMGRLAPEKNLEFLAEAVAAFVGEHDRAHFLVVGAGPSESAIRRIFSRQGIEGRLHMVGVLHQPALANALHAMDVFTFSSTSETQGMVLTEAMAAGLPVVALDAPGAREVVRDEENGRLIREADRTAFSAALNDLAGLSAGQWQAMREAALETAEAFSMPRSADKALECYGTLQRKAAEEVLKEEGDWQMAIRSLKAEWAIFRSMAGAGDAAISGESSEKPSSKPPGG